MPLSFWYYLTTAVEIWKTLSDGCLPFPVAHILMLQYKPNRIHSRFEAQMLNHE